MSFGRLFATIFFAGLCPGAAVLLLLSGATPLQLAAALFGLLAALALSVALVRGRGWARWVGAGAALACILLGGRIALERGGLAELLFVLAAMATFVLLVLVGGARGSERRRGAWPEIGTAVGTLGLAATLLFTPDAVSSVERDDAGAMTARRADRVVWADFGTGLDRARREGRPVLAYFYAGWCGYCKRMDRDTWGHPGVIERMDDVTAVRVNIDQTQPVNGFSGAELAARYGVHGTPSQLLLDENGDVVARAGGYQDPGQLLSWLDAALNRPGRRRPTTGIPVSTAP